MNRPTEETAQPGSRALLRLAAAGMIVLYGATSLAGAGDVLTLATTTSTENSGLLAHIHPDFTEKTGIAVKVIAKGTGAALRLARDGNADVVLVHAPSVEEEFVAEGYGVMRRRVMHNDFVIIGPAADPAKVQQAKDPPRALQRIAARGHRFISRGDASGTHVKEQELWRQTGLLLQTNVVSIFDRGQSREARSVRPDGAWYRSIGQGMGKTIVIATEQQAYTLADRGTYYAFALARPAKTDLRILCSGGESLYNPYGVIAVNPARHPHVNASAAKKYIRWITSAGVQEMIARYKIQGEVLFHPDATPTTGQ